MRATEAFGPSKSHQIVSASSFRAKSFFKFYQRSGVIFLHRLVHYMLWPLESSAYPRKLIIAMEHTTTKGAAKIVKELSFSATGLGVVNKIFTDLAVIEVTPEGLVLQEVFPGLTAENIQSVTEAKLIISPSLKDIEL